MNISREDFFECRWTYPTKDPTAARKFCLSAERWTQNFAEVPLEKIETVYRKFQEETHQATVETIKNLAKDASVRFHYWSKEHPALSIVLKVFTLGLLCLVELSGKHRLTNNTGYQNSLIIEGVNKKFQQRVNRFETHREDEPCNLMKTIIETGKPALIFSSQTIHSEAFRHNFWKSQHPMQKRLKSLEIICQNPRAFQKEITHILRELNNLNISMNYEEFPDFLKIVKLLKENSYDNCDIFDQMPQQLDAKSAETIVFFWYFFKKSTHNDIYHSEIDFDSLMNKFGVEYIARLIKECSFITDDNYAMDFARLRNPIYTAYTFMREYARLNQNSSQVKNFLEDVKQKTMRDVISHRFGKENRDASLILFTVNREFGHFYKSYMIIQKPFKHFKHQSVDLCSYGICTYSEDLYKHIKTLLKYGEHLEQQEFYWEHLREGLPDLVSSRRMARLTKVLEGFYKLLGKILDNSGDINNYEGLLHRILSHLCPNIVTPDTSISSAILKACKRSLHDSLVQQGVPMPLDGDCWPTPRSIHLATLEENHLKVTAYAPLKEYTGSADILDLIKHLKSAPNDVIPNTSQFQGKCRTVERYLQGLQQEANSNFIHPRRKRGLTILRTYTDQVNERLKSANNSEEKRAVYVELGEYMLEGLYGAVFRCPDAKAEAIETIFREKLSSVPENTITPADDLKRWFATRREGVVTAMLQKMLTDNRADVASGVAFWKYTLSDIFGLAGIEKYAHNLPGGLQKSIIVATYNSLYNAQVVVDWALEEHNRDGCIGPLQTGIIGDVLKDTYTNWVQFFDDREDLVFDKQGKLTWTTMALYLQACGVIKLG